LVVAARATAELPSGLKDSKLLSKIQRFEILNDLSLCCTFGEGWVKAAEIDTFGLSKALKLGARRALRNLQVATEEEIVLDGSFNYLPKKFKNSRALIDGDNLLQIVSAASIYAKVTRDNFMVNLSKRHPRYSFEKNVGYGTKTHMLALKQFGAIKYVHRYSYTPIAELTGV